MGETQKKGKEENRTYNEDFYCIACRSDIWNYFYVMRFQVDISKTTLS